MIAARAQRRPAIAGVAAWLRRPGWFGATRGELLVYALILALAAGLRFWDLGSRTLHHDEAIHAKGAFDIVKGQQYRYDPAYHGPFLYFGNVVMFVVFGASETVARLLPAVFGVGAVAAVLLFRPELGRLGTPLAMFALTTSTGFLYYSRFTRMDIFVAFFTLVMFGAVIRYLARPDRRWIYVAWAALALSFATKENTFIHGFMLVVVLGVLATTALAARWWPRLASGPLAVTARAAIARFGRDTDALIYGALVFVVVTFVLFTAFLTNLSGFRDAFTKSIAHWTAVHAEERVNQPWFYYLMFLAVYEPFGLLFGALAALRIRTSRGWLPILLALWAGLALLIYSAAGEKAPWLSLHITWPLLLLASYFVGARIQASRRWVRRLGWSLAAAAPLAWTVWFAIPATFARGDVPNDFVVYVQSAPDVQTVTAIIDEAARRSGQGRDLNVLIEDTYSWPFAWYLRDYQRVAYVRAVQTEEARQAAVILMSPATAGRVGIELSNYVGRQFKLRWWFPEFAYKDWQVGVVGEFLRDPAARASLWTWLITRGEPPVPLGSFDFLLYVRVDLLRAGPLGPFRL